MNKEQPYVEIRLVGTESKEPTLSDVGLFLNDVDTLYELLRLALDPKYSDFEFSRFALYRGGRHLRTEDKQYLEKLRHESPIEVQTVIAIGVSINAISAFVQMLIAVGNQPLNRRKTNLEVEKLEADLRAAQLNAENAELDKRKKQLEIAKLEREEKVAIREGSKLLPGSEIDDELFSRGASEFIKKVATRLENSPVRIGTVEAKVVDPISHRQEVERLHRWIDGEEEEDNNV